MPRDDHEDDDRPRRRRHGDDDFDDARRRHHQAEDDYEDEPRRRRPEKQVSILGIFSLVKGIGALIASFVPCIGAIAILPGLLGLVLGIIGYVIARKSNGRQGTGLPVAGMSVSAAAIVIAGIWIGVMGAISGTAPTGPPVALDGPEATGEVAVTAGQLDRAFEANERKGHTDYEGKTVVVTGVIDSIARDQPGVVVVRLEGAERSTVVCELRKDNDGPLAGKEPGDQVTLRGKCKGRVNGRIKVDGCVVVDAPAAGPSKGGLAAKGGAVIRVTAVQFARDYVDDEILADRKYKDKVLEVTGVIDGFDTDDPKTVIVQLKGAKKDFKDVVVDCEFARAPAVMARLDKLDRGETVTIRGKCTGHTLLEECVLVRLAK